MLKLSTIPVVLRETLTTKAFAREPEPDLIMTDESQVNAFTQAGREGVIAGVYAYHVEHATPTIQGARTVLDLGCGSGTFLIKMARTNPDIQFIGLDLSESMLEVAHKAVHTRGLKNIQFRKCDFTNLTAYSDASVDAVMSLQALHHLPTLAHLERMYSEVRRVLVPDGAIYFQDLLRLKRKQSVLHFAYYDPHVPELTQLDGERSLRAAFSFPEFENFAKTYLPQNVKCFKTGVIGLYMVQKTPDRTLKPETKLRLDAYLANMPPQTRKFYKDIRFFHYLGGLK